ncbi:MAG: hypothetical protein AAGA27_05395 [Pseudomonadota bacterium]
MKSFLIIFALLAMPFCAYSQSNSAINLQTYGGWTNSIDTSKTTQALNKKGVSFNSTSPYYNEAKCPDPHVNAVIASTFYDPKPIDYDNKVAMNNITQISLAEGYNTVLLTSHNRNPELIDNSENLENWLSCPKLKEVVIDTSGSNLAFGTTDGIVSYRYFSNYQKTFGHKLSATIISDSSAAGAGPLKKSILAAGAKTYIAASGPVFSKFSPKDLTYLIYRYFSRYPHRLVKHDVTDMLAAVDPVRAKTDGMYYGQIYKRGSLANPITVSPKNQQQKTTTKTEQEVTYTYKTPGTHILDKIQMTLNNGKKIRCAWESGPKGLYVYWYPRVLSSPTVAIEVNQAGTRCFAYYVTDPSENNFLYYSESDLSK